MGILNTMTMGIMRRYRKFNLVFVMSWLGNSMFNNVFSLTFIYSLFTLLGSQPSNWSPNCLKYLQSLYLNVNVQVICAREIVKYATVLKNREAQLLIRQCQMASSIHHLNTPQSIVFDDAMNSVIPKCEMSDDEQHIMETLIR